MGFVAEILGIKKPKQKDLPPPTTVDQSQVEAQERRLIGNQQRTIFTSPSGLLGNSDTKGKRLLGE